MGTEALLSTHSSSSAYPPELGGFERAVAPSDGHLRENVGTQRRLHWPLNSVLLAHRNAPQADALGLAGPKLERPVAAESRLLKEGPPSPTCARARSSALG